MPLNKETKQNQTTMFHSFYIPLARSKDLPIFPFLFILWNRRNSKVHLVILIQIFQSGLDPPILLQSPREFYDSYYWKDVGLSISYLLVRSNFNLLNNY